MAGKKNGSSSSSNIVLLAAAIMGAFFVGLSSAATYTVGGSTGWTFPPNTNFYSTWASQQVFQVGDVLVFNFMAGKHTVAQVSRASYDSCNTSNTLSAPLTTTPAQITLTAAGTHYFICTIPGHCSSLNQKLSVVVTGASTAPSVPPQPATTPPPARTPAVSAPTAAPQASRTPPPATTPTAAPQASRTPPPSTSPIVPTPSPATSPPTPTTTTADAPSVPSAGGSVSAPPPSGNFAVTTVTGVGFLSVVSVAAALLL